MDMPDHQWSAVHGEHSWAIRLRAPHEAHAAQTAPKRYQRAFDAGVTMNFEDF